MKRVIIGLILLTAMVEAGRNGGAIHSINISSPIIIIAAFFRKQLLKLRWSDIEWLYMFLFLQGANMIMWTLLGGSRFPEWKNEITIMNLIAIIVFWWLILQDWKKVENKI